MIRAAAFAAIVLALTGCEGEHCWDASGNDCQVERDAERLQANRAKMASHFTVDSEACLVKDLGVSEACRKLFAQPVPGAGPAPTAGPGLTIRTDAVTGCQYLESSKGFLTPRLDSDNQLVCSEGEE